MILDVSYFSVRRQKVESICPQMILLLDKIALVFNKTQAHTQIRKYIFVEYMYIYKHVHVIYNKK